MTKKTRTPMMEKAFKMGIAAFGNGIRCVPASDKSLMEMMYGDNRRSVKIGSPESKENNACFKAWLQGWTFANIGAGN